MNASYLEVDGKPRLVRHEHLGLGLAVDVAKDDGSRTLLVPCIRDADTLDFRGFWQAYEDIIRKVRNNKLSPDDFAGTTVSLTNPGTIGTERSVPRLMPGQGLIVGVGRIDYPAAYEAADPRVLADLGLSKVITVSSTYDHRIIQGAESGLFLKRVHDLLLGEDGFYEDAFRSLGVPYEAVQWRPDIHPLDRDQAMLEKQMQVNAVINAHRVRGHLIADLDPLAAKEPHMHAELDPATYGLTIWDLDREFLTGTLGGAADRLPLGEILRILRDAYCRRIGIEYMHIQEPEEKRWIQEHVEGVDGDLTRRGAPAHPRAPQRRRGLRAVPGQALRRPEAVRAGRGRVRHPPRRRRAGGRRRGGPGRRGAGHGPPGPAQRADQRRRQVLRPALRRVRGLDRPRDHPGLGRREVPPRPVRQVRQPQRRRAAHRAGGQPVAPRGRRPGRHRHGAGPSGPDRPARDLLGPAAADPRRRRVRRPGRRGRDPAEQPDLRLPGRRHDPPGHQQPARLHHPARVGPLVGVPDRHRQDGRLADHPRERRRSRGLRAGRPAGASPTGSGSTRTS